MPRPRNDRVPKPWCDGRFRCYMCKGGIGRGGRGFKHAKNVPCEERRKNCRDFLKVSRAEYDRLLESSPTIDQDIIALFNKRFNKDYPHVSKPIVCNGLREVRVYKEPSHADDTPVDDTQNEP